MAQIHTSDISKGDKVQLRNGWQADVMDNCKTRSTRLCKVYGFETEIDSVYSHDIVARLNSDGTRDAVVMTDKQFKFMQQVASLGF